MKNRTGPWNGRFESHELQEFAEAVLGFASILASEMPDEQRGAIRERLDAWSKADEQKVGRALMYGWFRNAMDTAGNLSGVSKVPPDPPLP